MKKFLFLLLTVCYFTSTSGATLYIHECMGKVVGWQLGGNDDDTCHKCGMHKDGPGDCCKDNVKTLKAFDGDQFFVTFAKNLVPALPVARPFIVNSRPISYKINRVQLPYILQDYSVPRNILYCTYLI